MYRLELYHGGSISSNLPVAGFCIVISGLFIPRGDTQPPVNKQEKFPIYLHMMLNKYTFTIPLISIICVFFFITKTVLRNRDWQNEYAFWTKILREQPQNYDAHNNLLIISINRELDQAIYELEEAIRFEEKLSRRT